MSIADARLFNGGMDLRYQNREGDAIYKSPDRMQHMSLSE